MQQDDLGRLADILDRNEPEIQTDWIQEQASTVGRRDDLISEAELRQQSTAFLRALRSATRDEPGAELTSRAWEPVVNILTDISQARALQGFTPAQTATFVFSLKSPLFRHLRQAGGGDGSGLVDAIWAVTELLDKLGLFATEVFQRAREEVINRQQQEMLELSTPVVKLWDGILALPMIGTLDSQRTQIVMEALLQRIVETGAEVAIIDITGVPTVDTLTAQHLLKTVTAARLMGADCIISGIRPQIAQTIVHLGVELTDVITKATLADAFHLALRRAGLGVTPNA